MPWYYYVSGSFLVGCWVVLLWRGVTQGIVKRFPSFYVFVVISAVCYLTKVTAALVLGLRSEVYPLIYVWGTIPPLAATVAVLWSLSRERQRRLSWLAVLLAGAVGAAVMADTPITKSYQALLQLTNGLYAFITAFGCLVILHLGSAQRLAVGFNVKAQLGGLVFPNALSFLAHLAYFSGLPIRIFTVMAEPIYVMSWGVMTVGMWRLDPPRVMAEDFRLGD